MKIRSSRDDRMLSASCFYDLPPEAMIDPDPDGIDTEDDADLEHYLWRFDDWPHRV